MGDFGTRPVRYNHRSPQINQHSDILETDRFFEIQENSEQKAITKTNREQSRQIGGNRENPEKTKSQRIRDKSK